MPTFTPYPADIVNGWKDEPIQAIVLPHDACGFLPELDEYRFPQYDNEPLYRFVCTEEYCYPGHAAYGDDDLAPTEEIAADIWNYHNSDWDNLLERDEDGLIFVEIDPGLCVCGHRLSTHCECEVDT